MKRNRTKRNEIKQNETKRVSHNTSPLSVDGYTKPSAELEINVDVKYVGEDERTDRRNFRKGGPRIECL
jgi:hypothetical protein